jgi:anti-sigma B factor antagonist
MNFSCDNRDRVIIIHLTGNIDASSHSQFTSQPEFAVQGKDLILDFSAVEYMDSAGLGGLVLLIRSYRQAGRKCILAGAPPLVTKIFKITAIERMTQVLPNLQSALQAVGGN